MKVVVCSLFEGNYQLGLGALINSLYNSGYEGDIYVGYKGLLKGWSSLAKETSNCLWEKERSIKVKDNLNIRFIHLDTSAHLTNFKPNFISDLFQKIDAEAIAYYDPDIVQVASWKFIADWISYGVALCEDGMSPVFTNHPRRLYWKNFYNKFGEELIFNDSIYVNGGFIGIKKQDIEFLKLWIRLQDMMVEDIGSLSSSYFDLSKKKIFENPFSLTDQDALNATLGLYKGRVTCLGKHAMGFEYGQGNFVMPHAWGLGKPWTNNYLKNAQKGIKPRAVDSFYWNNVNAPIKVFPDQFIAKKKRALRIADFITRLYHWGI